MPDTLRPICWATALLLPLAACVDSKPFERADSAADVGAISDTAAAGDGGAPEAATTDPGT